MNEHPLNALPQGYRLQEYELVRVLGLGGFGVTYLGYDHNLDKPVAVKEYLPVDIAVRTENKSIAPKASTFREDFAWGLDRFLDEARTLARFDHRNIVKVYRYFEANGTAYIVMEYAEGETLSAFLSRKGTLDESELKAILIPLLDGLETVHAADFLHRDIKPANIILRDEDASPVLVDFGAARQAISGRSQSVTTIVTPGYAPIEQYSSRGNQGPWTDIYALGAVCYRALTGDTSVDAIDRLENDPLEPISKRCAGKGGLEFLKAIDSALNVTEGGRPQTVTSWKTAVMSAGPTPQVESMAATNDTFKNPETLTNWTRGFLFACIGISVVLIGSNVLEYLLLVEIKGGSYPGDTVIETSDARQAMLAILQLAVILPTMVFVLMWIYRANYNVRHLGASGLRYSPKGSVGWYFVPVLSLWRPYQAMKEIYQASQAPHEWADKPVPSLLPLWWTLWLVSILITNQNVRLSTRLDENSGVDDFITSNFASQAAAVTEIALTLVLLAIIKKIYRMQVEHRRQTLDA